MKNNSPIRGFWQNIIDKRRASGAPAFVVAPMADVTDEVFRGLIAKYSRMGSPGGGPDVMWTEFVSADGLASKGRAILKRDLVFGESERPIVAQLFTSNPETMRIAVSLCKELGFDGVDINMGCPDRSIEAQGAGAKLITTPDKAKEVISAAQEAADDMPVSVKTRLGFNRIEYQEWLPHLLSMNIPALTIHLRTRKELSLVPAHWELAEEIVAFIREQAGELEHGGPFIIFNGDVTSLEDGLGKAKLSGCDGIMVGRGIFGTPWFFDTTLHEKQKTVEERLRIAIEHTYTYEKRLGDIKSFAIMKKHYKAYANGFDGAKELRVAMMEASSAADVEKVVTTWLSEHPDIATSK